MKPEESKSNPANQRKVKCFGSKAALTVEACPLITNGEMSGETLNLDVAPRERENVIWEKKITVQLSENELPIFACVCLGYLPKGEFKRPSKGITVERQSNKLYISATQGAGNIHGLPIPIGQTFHVGNIALMQLQKQTGNNDSELLIAALRGAAALYRITDKA